MGIIIGLGSGRSGTKSLAKLVDAQPGACCFHEINPSSMAWTGAEDTVYSLMRDFEATLNGGYRCATVDRVVPDRTEPLRKLKTIDRVRLIGDVANYYLPYVGFILEHWPDTRFVCLRREREATIKSFAQKLRGKPNKRGGIFKPKPKQFNHWLSGPANEWKSDKIWDRCFPKFELPEGAAIEDYIARYYDYYYELAETLEHQHPAHFRIFSLDSLASAQGQTELLEFCDPMADHVNIDAHVNKGTQSGTRHKKR